ncbi:hypothetical protein ACO0K7_03460 [Undibacterium sp. Ji67W]|uniref:hypothetical protein n=1 Tax=Undibacterium sp. Ji67W TaxID=3413042 RepID=UPI003BF21408
MNAVFKRVFILYFCLIFPALASEVPRLFMLTKGEHVAFVLPVRHVPSLVEKDDYLAKVIEEVFSRSTVLVDESAQTTHIIGFAYMPCDEDEFPEETEIQKKLDEKFNVISKYDVYRFPDLFELKVNNFAKLMMLLLGPISANMQNLPPGIVPTDGQVSTQLSKKFHIERLSIEGINDFHQSYCSLNSHEKTLLIKDIVSLNEGPDPLSEPNASNQYIKSIGDILSIIDVTQNYTVDSIEKYKTVATKKTNQFAFNKFILASRNILWVKKMNDVAKDKGIPFYALGIWHFLSNNADPGLFDLLRKEGFSVKLINSLDDVPQSIKDRVPLVKALDLDAGLEAKK